MLGRVVRLSSLRRAVQVISAVVSNSYLKGFAQLGIYQGPAKYACVPFLNCYSCPGAWAACPVGAMQALLAAYKHQFSFYIAGLLTVVGGATGRLVCGWFCPFGLVQEILGRFSSRKLVIPRLLTRFKFIILALTLLLPVLLVGEAGVSSPYFCKFICPAGTLEAGVPLGLGRPELMSVLGGLFSWKLAVMVFFLVASVFTFRPFCQTTCPLGAFYALFNRISLWRIEVNPDRCVSCGRCRAVCPLAIDVPDRPNGGDCIRCLECRDACPTGALAFTRAPVFPDAVVGGRETN